MLTTDAAQSACLPLGMPRVAAIPYNVSPSFTVYELSAKATLLALRPPKTPAATRAVMTRSTRLSFFICTASLGTSSTQAQERRGGRLRVGVVLVCTKGYWFGT